MLELKHVSFSVPENGGEKRIIDDVSLTLPDNEFIAVTGPNGGGKSTMAKLIAGIELPTEGSILFDGIDITKATVTDRANMGISYAFQQPVRFRGIKVLDLLRIASGNEKLTVSEGCEHLSAVGLCARDYINREVNASLSGGELKRIEIATVLARKTRFTIFDEPEAGIDLWSFKNLIQVFRSLRDKIHGTILIISHQERILDIADEIVVLSDGKLTEVGKKADVLPKLLGSGEAYVPCNRFGDEEKTT